MKSITIVFLTALAVNVSCFGVGGQAAPSDSLPNGIGGANDRDLAIISDPVDPLDSESPLEGRYRRDIFSDALNSSFAQKMKEEICKGKLAEHPEMTDGTDESKKELFDMCMGLSQSMIDWLFG